MLFWHYHGECENSEIEMPVRNTSYTVSFLPDWCWIALLAFRICIQVISEDSLHRLTAAAIATTNTTLILHSLGAQDTVTTYMLKIQANKRWKYTNLSHLSSTASEPRIRSQPTCWKYKQIRGENTPILVLASSLRTQDTVTTYMLKIKSNRKWKYTNLSLSQQGVWASFRDPNPQKTLPSRTPFLFEPRIW